MRRRWGAAALASAMAVLGLAVFAEAGSKSINDPAGDHPDDVRGSDIVGAKAKASAKSLKFTVEVAGANYSTKSLTSIRLRGKPGGNYYLNVTNYGDGGTSEEWRPYDYAKAKISRKGNEVSFKIKRKKVGNPKKIRWIAVSGAGGRYDYAPNKGYAKVKAG